MKTDKRCLRTYPDYYNVKYTDNGEKGSAKLDQDSLWRFVDPQDQEFFWWRWGHLYEVERVNERADPKEERVGREDEEEEQ